ncbi:MAG: cytidylate kinase-like family protein [Bacillota bacterium]|nr:cytidylate kinase-like family protein [Bacillota bacterium]
MSEDRGTIITIARQYGSGGRHIGRLLAQSLGCPFYDKDLIRLAAEESGISSQLFLEADEKAAGSFWNNLAANAHSYGARASAADMSLNDRLFIIQSNIIKEVAEKGPCVIVGRCGDYVLRDHPRAVHIFIHGSEKDREARLVRFYGVKAEDAADVMHKMDKKRASYYNYYTGQKWGQAENYHLSVNSSILGVENTAEILQLFARLRQEQE